MTAVSKPNVSWSAGSMRLVQREHVVVDEVQLDLGVGAVQVHVAAQEVQPPLLGVEVAGDGADPVAARGQRQRPLGQVVGALARGQRPLDDPGAGEAPRGQPDGAAGVHVERVPGEVLADVVVQLPERQGVACARAEVEVARARRPAGGVAAHGDDRVDHQVDRHDVDDRVRGGGQLGELAAAVGQDDRVGHLEALDPARVGRGQGGLDDARAGTPWSGSTGGGRPARRPARRGPW